MGLLGRTATRQPTPAEKRVRLALPVMPHNCFSELKLFAFAALFAALTSTAATEVVNASEELPRLRADLAQTSVSGLSSGAYMATQFQIAHSSIVIGAGIVAGGPYGCAESAASRLAPFWFTAVGYNLTQALQGCMQNRLSAWGIPDAKALAKRAETFSDGGRIDPLGDIKSDRVYLYSGTADDVILPAIMDKAREFYRLAGVPDGQVEYVRDGKAGHAIVTMTEGAACGVTKAPFLTDCDYDQAGAILKHIYGNLTPPDNASGVFTEFTQKPYSKGLSRHGLADNGYAYIPAACRNAAGCRVHVAFHGCSQGYEFVGDAHVKGAGFHRWADANRLIVLYPQVQSEPLTNPKGCWDWWGYTQLDFLTQKAPQITAVRRMLAALSE